jgi:dTDP-4-dehydrorhamnose reductase
MVKGASAAPAVMSLIDPVYRERVKVIVLGARGLLGRHLVDELRPRHAVRALGREECDITDGAAVAAALAEDGGAEAVVSCAAFTNVDAAEREPERAFAANVIGSENVARAARDAGVRAVLISTDFVFDGKSDRPYHEEAVGRPLSLYGRTKWEGEERARAVGGELLIVRVQGLYGRGGTNFASRLPALLAAGRRLRLDGERRVQPTYVRAAARQVARLLEAAPPGTYHAACDGETTWAGFTRALAARLGLPLDAEEVPSAAVDAAAARPPFCLLARGRSIALGLDVMPSWEAALDEAVADLRRIAAP